MDDTNGSTGFKRRTVLKTAATAAVAAGAFSGVASATNPGQINFCGCSQVCLEREETGGTFDVVLAREDDSDDGWEFDFVERPMEGRGRGRRGFCYEIDEDSEWKIISVRAHNSSPCGGRDPFYHYCNPGQCAQKALAAYRDLCDNVECVNCDPDDDGCVPAFGVFDDPRRDDPDGRGTVEIVRGRCGTPGKDDPSQGPE